MQILFQHEKTNIHITKIQGTSLQSLPVFLFTNRATKGSSNKFLVLCYFSPALYQCLSKIGKTSLNVLFNTKNVLLRNHDVFFFEFYHILYYMIAT